MAVVFYVTRISTPEVNPEFPPLLGTLTPKARSWETKRLKPKERGRRRVMRGERCRDSFSLPNVETSVSVSIDPSVNRRGVDDRRRVQLHLRRPADADAPDPKDWHAPLVKERTLTL
jgi:hypothetical protein